MQSNEFYKYLQNPQALNHETLAQLQEICNNYPYFELGWMLYLKNLKKLDAAEFDAILPIAAIRVANRKLLHRFLFEENIFETEVVSELLPEKNSVLLQSDENKNQGESLIDKFLQTGPQKIRPVATDAETAQVSENKKVIEESVTEKDDFITETLANIYFQQKNYEKAIESFKKLSLKYPEKSVYFASRIKEIEKIKNN